MGIDSSISGEHARYERDVVVMGKHELNICTELLLTHDTPVLFYYSHHQYITFSYMYIIVFRILLANV